MSLQQATPQEGSAADILASFTHRFASVNGTRLHYVAGGNGPAIVLLHGWLCTWAAWHKLMPLPNLCSSRRPG